MMRKFFKSTFSKEIIAILVIKLALIIVIKLLWFSNPQQDVQQSFTKTLFGESISPVKKETP